MSVEVLSETVVVTVKAQTIVSTVTLVTTRMIVMANAKVKPYIKFIVNNKLTTK